MRLHIRPIDDWNDARKAEKLARQNAKEPLVSKELNALLVKAVLGNQPKTAEQLLKMGASPDAQLTYEYAGDEECYPLMNKLVQDNNVPMARLLVTYKANLSKADTYSGHTPLHEAARLDHPAMMRLMLDTGAALNDTTSIFSDEGSEVTPLKIAQRHAWSDIIRMLTDEPQRRRDAERTAETEREKTREAARTAAREKAQADEEAKRLAALPPPKTPLLSLVLETDKDIQVSSPLHPKAKNAPGPG